MKKIKAKIKLQIPAGKATPAPPVGPALGQHGLDIREFCEKFNEATRDWGDYEIPVKIIVFEDKTYEIKISRPSTSDLLKKAAGIEKGSPQGRKTIVGKIKREKLREIAQIKLPDLNVTDIEKAMKIIEGQAKNMGIEIED
jgi:large subunit ribosomal protein L11